MPIKWAVFLRRDRSVILRHIRNIYKTSELDLDSTCAKIAQVAADGKVREMDLYNLDMIIGVGYRVNSRRGTEFRIWATSVLREHILKGYTLNEKRLRDQVARLSELQAAVDVMARVIAGKRIVGVETDGLLRVIAGLFPGAPPARPIRPPAAAAARHDGNRTLRADLRGGARRHRPDGENDGRPVRPGKGQGAGERDRRRVPGLRRPRSLSQHRGKGRAPALLCRQEPRLRGRQQAHRRRFCSSGSWMPTTCSTARTDRNGWPTTLSSR